MGRKYRHLFERIIDPNNLKRAYGNAARGKTNSHGYLVFREHYEARIATLHAQLADGTWQSQPYRNFTVYEPKQRSISAPTFSDRVVHHAVVQVIEPIFDATFLPYSFACRNGKGTHAGVKWVQSRLRSGTYTQYLKTDFKSFFPSVDRAVLHDQFARKISCAPTLDLLARIIPATGQGIPIGALTSQLSANIYANPLDHYLHHELKVPFARYMDDVVVLGHRDGHLKEVKAAIEEFSRDRLHLEISRWNISSTARGINFLGYRIWSTHKLLRKSSVTRAKRKIRTYTADGDTEALRAFIASWRGHAAWADTHNLHAWLEQRYMLSEVPARPPRPTRQDLLLDLLGGTSETQ